MRRYSLVIIIAVLGCALDGCGNEQPPAPPVQAGKLPSDPMAGTTVPKKAMKGGGGALPTMP
jgi:hypothetical protein